MYSVESNQTYNRDMVKMQETNLIKYRKSVSKKYVFEPNIELLEEFNYRT